MNLNAIRFYRPNIQEVQLIGLEFKTDTIEGALLAMTLHQSTLSLWLLYQPLPNNLPSGIPQKHIPLNTNRRFILHNIHCHNDAPLSLQKIELQNTFFSIHSSETILIGEEQQWQFVLPLNRLLEAGLWLDKLENRDLNGFYLMEITLEGTFSAFPFYGCRNWNIVMYLHDTVFSYPTRKKIKLQFEKKQNRSYTLQGSNGEFYSFYIHNAYLYDVWAEQEKLFQDPRYLEHMTLDELEKMKREYYSNLEEICPKGYYFPIVEYETEAFLSFDLYSSDWLQQPPLHSNRAMLFFASPEEKTGRHGLPLKAVLLQYPVLPGTKDLNTELIIYKKTVANSPITVSGYTNIKNKGELLC